jgi:hypothetical protein
VYDIAADALASPSISPSPSPPPPRPDGQSGAPVRRKVSVERDAPRSAEEATPPAQGPGRTDVGRAAPPAAPVYGPAAELHALRSKRLTEQEDSSDDESVGNTPDAGKRARLAQAPASAPKKGLGLKLFSSKKADKSAKAQAAQPRTVMSKPKGAAAVEPAAAPAPSIGAHNDAADPSGKKGGAGGLFSRLFKK